MKPHVHEDFLKYYEITYDFLILLFIPLNAKPWNQSYIRNMSENFGWFIRKLENPPFYIAIPTSTERKREK